MRITETKYDIQDVVYLVTDQDQLQRIVTGIWIRPTGLMYEVSCAGTLVYAYEFELWHEKNLFPVLNRK